MSRLVMKDGKIVIENDNEKSQNNAAPKTNTNNSALSWVDGRIVRNEQQTVNSQKNAQYKQRTQAAQQQYQRLDDVLPQRRTNVMDMAIDSLRNRVANSTIGRATNEWASRVSGNIQNVLNESPEVRAAKRQVRADNEARRQQFAIDTAQLIDQASSKYEGPTRTETVRGKFTDTEGADMFSNDWEPGEAKEIEYTKTVRNENYNPLPREERDALISRYTDAVNGKTDANTYQQTLYDVTKNGGIEQLYREQQADAANDREYGRQLRGIDLDSMNFWQRLGETLGGTVAGAGEQIASSGLGLVTSGLNREAGKATEEFGPALEQTAKRWYYGLVNGMEDDPATEEQIRTLASYVGIDPDALISRVKDRAEQAKNSDEDDAVFAYGLLDGLEADQDKIWANAQQAISEAGFYDAINNLQQKSSEHIQYAKDVNLIQNQFGDNLVEAGVSTIQNAADAAMAATLGLTGTGIVAMIPFALRAYGGTYAEQMQQATELGGLIGQDVAKRAAKTAGLSSAIEVGTEMMWGMVGAMSKVTGGGALDDAAQERLTDILSGWAKTETGRKILTTVGEKALGGITEGLEEVIGDAAEQILKNAGIMPGEAEEWSDWVKNAGHSFITGALGGLLGEFTSVVSSPMQQSQIGKQLKTGGLDISLNELADLANSEGMENTSLAKAYSDVFSGMPRNIENISDLEAGKLYEAYEEMLGKRSEAIDRIEQLQDKLDAGETLTRADVNRITNNSEAVSILTESGAVSDDAFSGGINERRDAVEMALRAFANDSAALSNAQAENVQEETENANAAVSAPNPFLTMSSSAIDNIVRNAQPMSPVQSIRESNAGNVLTENVLRSAARVVDAAERLNVSERGQDVMARMYSPNMDAIDYVGQMTKYYNQGKEGNIFDVGSIEGVSAIQAQAAFNAGRQEYIERSNNGEEGLRVRTSSERQNGQSAGGPVGVLEESTGAAQGRQVGSFQREGGNARVSAESLRAEGTKAIEQSGLRIVTNDRSVAAAKKYAEDRGVNFVAYAGGALNIDGVQSRGYYDQDTNTVYVRADHRLFTAEQIAKHETTHAQIHNGEITLGEVNRETVDFATVRDALVNELGQERFDEMVDAYVEIYAGTNLSRQAVFEELICDSVAGMNDFVSVGHLEEAVKFAPSMSKAKAVAEENAANGTRAGPTESGGKYSGAAEVLALDNVDWMANNSSIKSQLIKHRAEIDSMDPVAVVSLYAGEDGKALENLILAQRENIGGGRISRSGIVFEFDDEGAHKIVSHARQAWNKAAALAAPYVAKYGKLIAGQKNHEDSGLPTLTYAAPVYIAGIRVNVGVVIQFETNGRPKAINVEADSAKAMNELKKATSGSRQRNLKSQVAPYTTGSFSADNIAEQNKSVKGKFSMDRPVERTDRLIALHNMGEDALRGMLEIGGLAMPSVAITRADMGHNTYGEISAVFGRDSISPTDRRNRIYSGDAWTPTFPEVGIKINTKTADAAYNRIRKLLGDEAKDFGIALDPDNLRDQIQRWGSFREAYKKGDAFRLAFLRDTGRTIAVPTKPVVFSRVVDNQALAKVLKVIDLEDANEHPMKYKEEVKTILRDYYNRKYGDELGEKLYGRKEDISFSDVENVIRGASRYKNNRNAKEVDKGRLEKRLNNAMQTKKIQAEYEAWMDELGKGLIEKRGIRNNTDFFTPYGNRRSFEQLYYPYTLANIVRAMEGQAKQGKTSVLTGAGNIKGAAAKQYASIEEARKDIGRLKRFDVSDANDAAIEAFNDHTLDLCNRMIEGKGHGRFGGAFDAAEVLVEVIPKYQTADGIYRYLKREGYDDYYNVTPEIAKEIENVIQEARQLPTAYFEGKMYRAVPITEALAYVVPDNMNKDLKQQLADAGANVVEYKHGNNEDRLAKVNSVKGARFSRDIDSTGKELSEGQKVYFADSKSRDDSGRLKVMYQGSPEDFTVFDRKKSKGSNLYGRGFYFTDNENAAKTYGKTKPYYLNVVNPLSPGQSVITRSQMRRFLEAVYDDQDEYSFENYGENATVGTVLKSLYGKGDFEMLQDVNATAIGDMVAAVELFNEVNGTEYDGLILPTETVVFSSAQVKNTDNQNPTENPDIRFSRELNPETLDKLNSEPTIKVYRAMQVIDGKLYPPMAAKVDGRLVEPTEIGVWYKADERKDLIKKNGKFKLDKANGSAIEAAYNPYFHTSRSPLNDQFSSAYNRPNLVTVEVEVPESELTSGYRAEGAKDAVGEMQWHSGPVSSKLKGEKARRVILSRWAKVDRIVPDAEVAGKIAEMLDGENITIPFNTVTPSLRSELEKRGVPVEGGKFSRDLSSLLPDNADETAKKVVENLRKRAVLNDMAAKYGSFKSTAYTDERIAQEIEYSYATGSRNRDYARAYIAFVKPEDFIMATSVGSWRGGLYQEVEAKAKEEGRDSLLDLNALQNERQSMFLRIEATEDGRARIIGHEGRHRMIGLEKEGYKYVPVIIEPREHAYPDGQNRYGTKPLDMLWLNGQEFGSGKGTSFVLHDILPLSANYADIAKEIFAGGQNVTKFSRDLSNTELYEANRQLQKDLTELRSKLKTRTEQYQYWKGQTKVTEGRQLRIEDVTKLAREIIKGQESSADAKAVAEKMKALGEYLLNSQEENVYDEARLKAYEVAHDILANAKTLNTKGGDDFYSDFRTALKNQPIYVAPSVREEVAPDGWNEFRKAQYGTVNMTADQSKGKSVDVVYHDLQATFGEWLLPEYIVSEADQLNRILEVIETYRPVYENLNSYEMADAVEWTANEILTRIIGEEIRETNPTYADRMEKKLADQKTKAQTAIRQVRQQRDRKVADLKAHYQQVAEDRRNRKIDSEMRSRLLKIAKRLNNKKLDRVTRGLLDQYIGELDLVSNGILGRTVKELETLQAWYDSYRESMGDDFIPDKFIERKIARLSKKHISDLTQEEVADLTTVLLNIENAIRTQNQLIESQIKMDAYAAGVQTIDDINNSNGKTGFLNKFISTETATPEREIHRITGYRENSPLYKAAKELSDGQRKMLDYQMRAEALFKKWTTEKKFIRRIAGKNAEEITVSGYVNGMLTDVKITPAMRMALYLHEKNDDNMRHITKGGVKIPDMALYKKGKLQEAYDKATRVVFTRGMLKEIASKMSADEKSFADAVDRYYNGMSRNEINDTSEALRGYAIAGVEHYYPIDTDGSFLKKEFDAIKRDGSIEGMGILKERIEGATNPIMLYDMNDTLNRSISQHSKYTGLAIPVRNFNKLYSVTTHNYETSVAETLKKNWGSAATSYIEKMMADVQNGTGLKSDAWGDLLARARSHYAGAVLNTNASVAMKQAASYPTAAAVVGYGPLMRALADVKKIDLDKLAQYTPLLWYRSKGFSTTELGDIGKEGGHIPKALNWIQAMDVATTTKLVKAAMYYVNENNNLTRGTDAWWKAVAEVYNRIIEETQPNYTMMQRPQILRSDNALTRALNMFKTQPFQNFNILYDAFGNLAAKSRENKANPTEESRQELKSARTNAVRAVTSQAVSAFIFALMQFAWDAFRGKTKKYRDKDDEMTLASWMKGMGINVLSSVGGMIPFGSYALELAEALTDAVLKGLKKDPVFDQTFYGLSENAAESMNDMGNALLNIVNKTSKALQGESTTETTIRSLVDSMGDIAQFAGIPLNNVIKLAQSIGRNIFLATEGKYVGGYYALRVTTDPSKYKSDYYDLLWKAYNNDKAAYNEIIQMMLDDGFEESKIKDAMEERMKDAQGVSHVDDLDSRWMAPAQQKIYDEGLADIENTTMFQAATDEQQKKVLTKLYNIALENANGKTLDEKIEGGADVGLDQTEYLLYSLALSMTNPEGGTPTNGEVEAAILMVPGLSKEERAYLWDAAGKSAKSNPWR